MLAFFMVQENIADDKFERFLGLLNVILNLVLDFSGKER
jgi:hypothetical protein